MKYNHLDEARCVFVVGPVAVYVCPAPEEEILAAMARIRRLVYTSTQLMEADLKEGPDDAPRPR